ncbi:bifunctional riboflavin kinase/FAD synthetase [Clostridium sediminicola]|uniref:bifunctional riboflavin kinase/FAD synthetase n=1 Tax=Clostridium sediminicola TaxID=3114879 RepID=UPI0031F26149
MIIIENSFIEKIEESTYITLGSFDGIHLGHLGLINKTIALAKEANAKSVVFTFKNHPLSIINKDISPKLLSSNKNKSNILSLLGVDILNFAEFNDEFMNMTPEKFIENIYEFFNPKGIIVGFNYRFGYKNLGDTELLQDLCSKKNIDLHIIKPVLVDNDAVSSSRIRRLISDGKVEKANNMLTRPFLLEGNIIKGKQLGRKLEFPTINLDYNKNLLIPRGGVYLTAVNYGNKIYKAITNIGYNPTVLNNKLSIETHLLDFNEYIYGEEVKIFFLERIRDEKKFGSLKKLAYQLGQDKSYAREKTLNYDVFY